MHDNYEHEIHHMPQPTCILCDSPGVMLYQELPDVLFASAGLWNIKQCPNRECGLMWLDPMPSKEEIHKAYHSYYTHNENQPNKNILTELVTKTSDRLLLFFLRFTPIYKERKDFNNMYLSNIRPGRLLEVGCGKGDRLAFLADHGWTVEGQEVDSISAAIAAKKGIKVHLGPLESFHLPASTYKAIVMSHVIEHIHEPLKVLTECRRLLSQNGILIAVTPNTDSLGHRIFKSFWRGLEPPRHVFLYRQKSLSRLALRAGFENPITWTTSANAHHFARNSLMMRWNNRGIFKRALSNIFSKLFIIMARIFQVFDKSSGEECVLMLKKVK